MHQCSCHSLPENIEIVPYKKLEFSKREFNRGLNLTVRRGVKWSLENKAYIEGIGTLDITCRIFRFDDLDDNILHFEHDEKCRTKIGLLETMKKLYEDFHHHEIVTLVFFNNNRIFVGSENNSEDEK